MQIRCTKKLLDTLKVVPEVITEVITEEDPLFSWHANLLMINRRKVVVLMNDFSRYTVILYGLKAKEFNNFNDIAVQGIREVLQADGITDEVIEQYLQRVGEVVYTKTKDRSSTAHLNKACDNVYFHMNSVNTNAIYQPKWSMKSNHSIVGVSAGESHYSLRDEKMHEGLALFAGQSIFGTEAVILKVSLRLGDHQIWRRLVVPIWKTFDQLHDMLQRAFDWQDYHLHDYKIYDNDGQPIINLVSDEEALSYPIGIEMKLERGVKLSEYVRTFKNFTYTYDFGDDWQHDIVVEKVIDDHDTNYAVCLAGEGDRPPEDVGGESGYEEYLRIIADPSGADYEHLMMWSKSQVARDFDLGLINHQLKRC